MKITLPIIVLAIAVLGCGRFGAGSDAGSNDAPKANTSPTPIVKAIDMPGLMGKSPDEVKKIVGIAPKSESQYTIEFALPQGDLYVGYTKGKQTRIDFSVKPIQIGSQTAYGFESPEKLGDLVGIDVHGKPVPDPNGNFYFYENFNLNGKTVKQVVFDKIGDSFSRVSIVLD